MAQDFTAILEEMQTILDNNMKPNSELIRRFVQETENIQLDNGDLLKSLKKFIDDNQSTFDSWYGSITNVDQEIADLTELLDTVAGVANLVTNADVMNEVATSDQDLTPTTATDGEQKKTLAHFERQYNAAIQAAGGVPLGTWAAGVTINAYNEYLVYNGVPYKPAASTTLPYTTQGADPTDGPDEGLVIPFSEVTRSDVDITYANTLDLKNGQLGAGQSVRLLGYYEAGDGGHGNYIITDNAPDGRVTCIPLDNGKTAELLPDGGAVRLSQVGCRGLSADEDTPLYQGLVYEAAGFDPSLRPFSTVSDFVAAIKENRFVILVDRPVKVYGLNYLPRTVVKGAPKGFSNWRSETLGGGIIEFVNLEPSLKDNSCFSCDLSYWVPSYQPGSNQYVDAGPVHESTQIKISGKFKYMVDYRYVYGHKFNSNQFSSGADFAFHYNDMFHFECKNNLGSATTGALKTYRVTTGDVSGNYITQGGNKSEDESDYVLSGQIEESGWGGVLKSEHRNTRALHILSSTINFSDNVFEHWDIYRAQFSGTVLGRGTYVEGIHNVVSATVACSGEETYSTVACDDATLMEHTSLAAGTAKDVVIIRLPVNGSWTGFRRFGKANYTNNCKIVGTLSALSQCTEWDLSRYSTGPRLEPIDAGGRVVFYVSENNGDDNNIGLLKSAPLKTLEGVIHRDAVIKGDLEFRFEGGGVYSSGNTEVSAQNAKLTSYGSGKATLDLSNGGAYKCTRFTSSNIAFDNIDIKLSPSSARNIKAILKGLEGEMNFASFDNVTLDFTNGYLIGEYSGTVYSWTIHIKDCEMSEKSDNGLNRDVPETSEKIILDAKIVTSNIDAPGFVGSNLVSPRIATL